MRSQTRSVRPSWDWTATVVVRTVATMLVGACGACSSLDEPTCAVRHETAYRAWVDYAVEVAGVARQARAEADAADRAATEAKRVEDAVGGTFLNHLFGAAESDAERTQREARVAEAIRESSRLAADASHALDRALALEQRWRQPAPFDLQIEAALVASENARHDANKAATSAAAVERVANLARDAALAQRRSPTEAQTAVVLVPPDVDDPTRSAADAATAALVATCSGR